MSSGSLTDPRPGLTKRQTEVLERLELGTPVRRIAKDIGVTPAAVYQTIERLRRSGHLAPAFTPSGRPPRRGDSQPIPAGSLATGGAAERLAAARAADEEAFAELVDSAIAAGDSPTLAYLLGRIDGCGGSAASRSVVEAALRRLGLLGGDSELQRRG